MKVLKPADGRTVDQEDGTPWPAEGMPAPDTLFVRRRLRDGDLVEIEPQAEAPAVVDGADDPQDPPALEVETDEDPEADASASKRKRK